jgi:rhodanese-related sulfurtransferase
MATIGYANPGALVETEWLQAHLDDPSVLVVEVDEDVTAYAKAHIPGAICWNWTADLRAVVGRDFIDQEGLTGLLRSADVNPDTTVVLYAGNNNWFAAYAYWLLKYLGFDAVKLLNGGRKKWELESRPLTDEVPSYPGGAVSLDASVRSEIRAFRNQVLARLRRGEFVDVRSPEEYRGEKLAPTTCPRNNPRSPATSPAPPTSHGARPPTRTAPSSPPTTCGRSTRAPASPPTRKSSPTAGSGNGPRRRGSRSPSCSATPTSRTTTGPGPSTGRWSESQSRRARPRSFHPARG